MLKLRYLRGFFTEIKMNASLLIANSFYRGPLRIMEFARDLGGIWEALPKVSFSFYTFKSLKAAGK